ncbi:hypothetical protein ACDA63_07170 [Uliginosibacterium sp. sgz301328]
MCRYESLKDGSLDLADIAEMHDMLTLQNDYDYLLNEYAKNQHG